MPAIADAMQKGQKQTRSSSIRHSLGLGSVGKALADVMNKESKETDKGTRKAVKESRRSSAVHLGATASRTAMREAKSSSPGAKRVETPDSKTITRRRASTTVAPKPAEATSPAGSGPVTRSALIRPRPGTSSGLPKYRPRSVIQDGSRKESPSPRPSTSNEKSANTSDGPDEAKAFKVDLPTKALHSTPPASPAKTKPTTPTRAKPWTPSRVSPTRPSKLTKAVSAAPSLSSSSSSSQLPRTPQTQTSVPKSQSPSPSFSFDESPLARHSRNASKASIKSATEAANMSHIAEVDSDDSDEEDVALLLAPVAALGAPTPAMPRIKFSRSRLAPKTPTRPALPTRAQLSYISPLPPDSGSPSARPHPPSGGAPRGSILSWEQMAKEASKTLGDEEIQNMISDVPAPFMSGAASPIMTSSMLLDIPESPCLSALNSPGDFGGSISQVLLPDVTPSPAVHHRKLSRGPFDVPVADGAIVTLLRMQLESAEHIAKERLLQLQLLEEEVHNIKQARERDAQQLSMQLGTMESELRTSLESRERSVVEQASYIAVLENQLKETTFSRDKLANEQTRVHSTTRDFHVERKKWSCASTAQAACLKWKTVHDVAESELESLDSDQQTLSLLLLQLECAQKRFA